MHSSPRRPLRSVGPAVCLAFLCGSGAAWAQDATALLASARTSMQDIENRALRNTMTRFAAASDAATGVGTARNVFTGFQQGQDNRLDAVQTGRGNTLQVTQIGDAQSAVVTQSGSFNQIVLRQGR